MSQIYSNKQHFNTFRGQSHLKWYIFTSLSIWYIISFTCILLMRRRKCHKTPFSHASIQFNPRDIIHYNSSYKYQYKVNMASPFCTDMHVQKQLELKLRIFSRKKKTRICNGTMPLGINTRILIRSTFI